MGEVLRCRSAASLRHTEHSREETANYDCQSEFDEDRVIVDADQLVEEARTEECDALESNDRLSKDVEEKPSDVGGVSRRIVDYSSKEELQASTKEEQTDMQFEGRTVSNTVEKQPETEYIPSYSKFQKLKERKKAAYNGESEADRSRKAGKLSSIYF